MTGYLAAILAGAIFVAALPFIRKGLAASYTAWRADGAVMWEWAKSGWKAGNSSWWHMLAAGVLLGVLLSNGPALWRIVGPLVPVIDIPVIVPVEGPRRIIIGYESTNASPAFKGALVGLRSGAAETALKTKGHSLDIIDVDEKDKDGNPTKAAVEYRASYPSLQIPVIIFRDQGGKVLHSEPLPTGATTASIMAIVEANQ